jgi:two-component system, chemotaxis family, CheB/CheR fusion protein
VIFLTANADESTLASVRSAGPFGFLTKPFRNEELLETIRIAIDQSKQVHSLFASQRWLTTVLDSLTDAVIATDAESRVRYLNPAAAALTGWTAMEAQGRMIEEIYRLQAFGGSTPEECLLRRALRTGEYLGKDRFVLITKTGARVAIEDSAAPIREDDTIVGAVTIFLNIEDRVELERQHEIEKDRWEEQAVSATQALGETRAELRALAANLMQTQERERRRIARELHDDLGQQTAFLGIMLDRATREGYISASISSELQAQAQRISTGLREVSHALHPSIIADLGLSAALHSLVEQERSLGHEILFPEPDVPLSVPLDTATAFYRIAQEALRNVAKHAPGAVVRIFLSRTSTELKMRIQDNGLGFSLVEVRSKGGLGLVSMQERARLVGGSLSLSTRSGKGTVLLVRAPIGD